MKARIDELRMAYAQLIKIEEKVRGAVRDFRKTAGLSALKELVKEQIPDENTRYTTREIR